MRRVHHRKESKGYRREVTQVVSRICFLPYAFIPRIKEQGRRIDFQIPNSAYKIQSILQVHILASPVIHKDQGRRNIFIGVRGAGIINLPPVEGLSNPRHKPSVDPYSKAPRIVPQTAESFIILIKVSQKHAVSNAFRHRTGSGSPTDISRIFYVAVIPIITVSLILPDNSANTAQRVIDRIINISRREHITEFYSKRRIDSHFLLFSRVMGTSPIQIMGHSNSRVRCRSKLRIHDRCNSGASGSRSRASRSGRRCRPRINSRRTCWKRSQRGTWRWIVR